MPRASMAALISRVRTLIGDPAGASATFTDDAIEAALDRYQLVVRDAPLRPVPTPLPGSGVLEYRDYYAALGDWEADVVLVDATWTPVVPATSDLRAGHWTFAPPGVLPPVYVRGQAYDIYGAAADLLEQWAAALARAYDFSTDGQAFQRSQQAQALRAAAAGYRRQQRPAVVRQGRPDLAAEEA